MPNKVFEGSIRGFRLYCKQADETFTIGANAQGFSANTQKSQLPAKNVKIGARSNTIVTPSKNMVFVVYSSNKIAELSVKKTLVHEVPADLFKKDSKLIDIFVETNST